MSDTPDVRELIADEFARFLREEGARDRPWDFADGLAAIVSPVIRRQVAEEIAQAIDTVRERAAAIEELADPPSDPQNRAGRVAAMKVAAAIARSHSTREEQDHD